MIKVKALVDFFMEGHAGFTRGEVYQLTPELAAILIEREQVEEVKDKPKEPERPKYEEPDRHKKTK